MGSAITGRHDLALLASFLRAPAEETLDTLSRVCGSLHYARQQLRWRDDGLPELGAQELAGEIPTTRIVEATPHRAIIALPARWGVLDMLYAPDPRAARTDFWNRCDGLAAPGQALEGLARLKLAPIRARQWVFDALLTPQNPGWLGWLFTEYQDAAVLCASRAEATPLEERIERVYVAQDPAAAALRSYGERTLDQCRVYTATAASQPPHESYRTLAEEYAAILDARRYLHRHSGWRSYLFGKPKRERLDAIHRRHVTGRPAHGVKGLETAVLLDARAALLAQYAEAVKRA